MATATKIKTPSGWRGDAAVYKLEPPYEDHEHVVVSAVILDDFTKAFDQAVGSSYRSAETMIFPCDAEGDNVYFGELAMVPRLSHEDALAELGYEVA